MMKINISSDSYLLKTTAATAAAAAAAAAIAIATWSRTDPYSAEPITFINSVSVKCTIISNIVYWVLGLVGLYADYCCYNNHHHRNSKFDNNRRNRRNRRPRRCRRDDYDSNGGFGGSIRKRIVEILQRCKIQPNPTPKPIISDKRQIQDLFVLATFNTLFVSFLICCPIFEYIWDWAYRNGDDAHDKTSSLSSSILLMVCSSIRSVFNLNHLDDNKHHHSGCRRLTEDDEWDFCVEMLIKLPINAIITDLLFYVVHAMMHRSTFLYQNIHKVHHRFKSPTAMTCVYSHPIEFVVGNILPVFMGCMVTNSHPYTCYLFWCLAMVGTCKGHSGYKIFGHEDYHEDHHLYAFHYNFGGMYLSDIVFGTFRPSTITSPKAESGITKDVEREKKTNLYREKNGLIRSDTKDIK